MKLPIILFILVLTISPIEIAIAEDVNIPDNSIQADVYRAMTFAPQVARILKRSRNSYGSMIWQTLPRFADIGEHEPIMIALIAKASGGRRKLLNGNYIGLYQILGFGPFKKYPSGIDNRRDLTKASRNIKEGILLLDKIFEEIWRVTFFRHLELLKIAKRFHCTPNRYSEIIYDCDGGQLWAEDWYYNYLPLANKAWYLQ